MDLPYWLRQGCEQLIGENLVCGIAPAVASMHAHYRAQQPLQLDHPPRGLCHHAVALVLVGDWRSSICSTFYSLLSSLRPRASA